ncbi:MAG: AAA family ATPase [Chitinophagaceae bacterium]|nr:MAG: AAA family ATPase [Chitinophagaceae bacterium]
MARALGVHELLSKKYDTLYFTGKWRESFGEPGSNFRMIVWGISGSGKTNFVLQLCKYLANFGKVAYDSLEEGDSKSIQQAFMNQRMMDIKGKIILIDRERIPALTERLKKRKSPKIVVIDSIQYAGMSYEDYKTLKELFPKKIFIFISHADGKEPDGKAARQVRYDCDIKVHVNHFKANVISRFGGNKPMLIWERMQETESNNIFSQINDKGILV